MRASERASERESLSPVEEAPSFFMLGTVMDVVPFQHSRSRARARDDSCFWPPCADGSQAAHCPRGIVLAAICWAASAQRQCYPTERCTSPNRYANLSLTYHHINTHKSTTPCNSVFLALSLSLSPSLHTHSPPHTHLRRLALQTVRRIQKERGAGMRQLLEGLIQVGAAPRGHQVLRPGAQRG